MKTDTAALIEVASEIRDIQWVLSRDTRIMSLREFSPEAIRRMLERRRPDGDGHFVLYRPRSRSGPVMIDASVERMLNRFRKPATCLGVVLRTAAEERGRPLALLRTMTPVLSRFVREGTLVRADRPGDKELTTIEPSLRTGTRLGGLKILAPLTATIDTEVYLAQLRPGVRCALKVSRPRFSTARAERHTRRQLEREFALLEKLGSTAACALLRSGRSRGRTFGALEWIEGDNADRHAANIRRSTPDRQRAMLEILDVVVRCLDALAGIHARGYLHGDIHPRNFLVSDDAVRIVDFGLAKPISAPQGGSQSGLSGVPNFLPPEAAAASLGGRKHFLKTVESEIYSMGALAYYLITGAHHLSFKASRRAAMRAIASAPMRSFRSVGSLPWPHVERVLKQALAKRKTARFSSVADFRKALTDAGTQARQARSRQRAGSPSAGRVKQVNRITRFVQAELAQLRPLTYGSLKSLQSPPYASVAFGGAGVAYALLKAAQHFDDADLLGLAANWIYQSVRDLDADTALYAPDGEITPDRVPSGSVFYSAPGLRAVQALVADAMDAETVRSEALDRLGSGLAAARRGPLDLYFGPPGLLSAMAILRSTIDDERPLKWGHRLWQGLIRTAYEPEQRPLRSPPWDRVRFLGLAHGWAGIYLSLLQWALLSGTEAPGWMHGGLLRLVEAGVSKRSGLDWPMLRGTRRQRFLTSLCHGAPGVTLTLVRAYQYYHDPVFLESARRAGVCTLANRATQGSLCCGAAGQAYSLLALDRIDSEGRWRDAAFDLACTAFDAPRSAGEPFGLIKGRAGLLCLALELLGDSYVASGCPLIESGPLIV